VQDRLLAYIHRHQFMRAGDRVGIAVSGGADSVALLRLLLELRERLGVVLAVVHFNHKLRGEESDQDEQFVRELAAAHDLQFFSGSAETRAYANERKCGIEAAARELRYAFFWKAIGQQSLKRIATAHTLDDQAETVFLRFLRGAGTRGLAGIYPEVKESGGSIVRPLLEFRRAQLRDYLKHSSQPWREDASNQDAAFARNKLRQELMPKLREFNAAIEQVLSETADIARTEEEYWHEIISRDVHDLLPQSSFDHRPATIALAKLLSHPLALQRRLFRAIAEGCGIRLEFHHVQQVLDLAAEPPTRAEKRVELPGDWDACIVERELRLQKRCLTEQEENYEFALPVPGEVEVPAAGLTIAARLLEFREGNLLDPGQIGSLRVRNWRPGDRYWPVHTRGPKKLKELLQARHVPAEARAHWPVVVTEVGGGEQIVWVPGFAFPEQFLLPNGNGPGLMLEHRARG